MVEAESGLVTAVAEALLDGADVLVVARDRAGRVTFANRYAREVLGYENTDLVGRNWFEACLTDAARGERVERSDRLLAGDADPPLRHEHPVVTRDGERRVVDWQTVRYRDADGDVAGTLSTGRDVTERRRREADLEASKHRYETLVDQFPNGIVTLFDEDHRYQVVGGTGFEHLGVSPADLEGARLSDVFPPENVETLEPLYDRAFEGESSTVEVGLEDHVFCVHVVPVRDDDGTVVAGMTMSQDVTERAERERELEAARGRYRTLLQAAPDPVFVADADTGDVVEVNEAAEAFRGEPREDIVGRHQTDLHPAAESDTYQGLFERGVTAGGSRRRLPDGSQIHAVTADGTRVPVEISAETVELADRTVIFGVFRDVSDQLEYERAMTELNEATGDLFTAETPAVVAERIVETVRAVLEPAAASVYLADETEGVLRQAAHAAGLDLAATASGPAVVQPCDHVAWRAFASGETLTVDDVRTERERSDPETPFRSEVVVPLGERGVLVAEDTAVGGFDDRSVELLKILGATAETALERTEREQQLRARERQLRERTGQLRQAEAMNAQIRELAQAIVQSKTRREIERAVCTQLVETDVCAFAWIGAVDPVEDRLTPRAKAGDDRGYLDQVARSVGGDAGTEPAVEAVRSGELTVVENTARRITRAPWRSEAVRRDFQSVLSVPLVYQGARQGVLTVYSTTQSAFPELMQSVLVELGELLANAIVAIERKQALLSNRGTELEFDVQDEACFFLRFAQDTNCALELESVIPQSDDSSLVFVRVRDGSPEQLRAEAEQTPAIESVRRVDSGEGPLVQLRFTEPFIASRLADHGITVRNISADESICRVTVAVPPTYAVHQAVEVVTSTYRDSELLAKRERTAAPSDSSGPFADEVLEKLTPRQREVVEAAYRRGYFESPRNASSDALASELGFSSSAFHYHVRAAERKLFEGVFESDAGESL